MSVQDTVRTVTVPRQAGPADPPLPARPPAATTPTAPAAAPLIGRDRPLTTDERQFVVALAVLLAGLTAVILTGLLMAEYVWS